MDKNKERPIKIALAGSCQLGGSVRMFFFNEEVRKDNNIIETCTIPLYLYSKRIGNMYRGDLNYNIFDDYDIIIIENNNYEGTASSERIIRYCIKKKKKIIRTCMLKFPIFPINWSGFGENKKDYIQWKEPNKIDYKVKFNECINSLKKNIEKTDLDMDIVHFIQDNFSRTLLFSHSLHPTNILLYKLYESIFKNLNIDINKYKFIFKKVLIYTHTMINPITTKMIQDLNIQFKTIPNDKYYIARYQHYKNSILNREGDICHFK